MASWNIDLRLLHVMKNTNNGQHADRIPLGKRSWKASTCTRVRRALEVLLPYMRDKSSNMGAWHQDLLLKHLHSSDLGNNVKRNLLDQAVSCIIFTFPWFFVERGAVPQNWTQGDRKTAVYRYMDCIKAFLAKLERDGQADPPKWEHVFANMLIYNPPAIPAVPPIVPPKANCKRSHSVASSTSTLTLQQQQDISTQHKRAVVAWSKMEKHAVTIERLKAQLVCAGVAYKEARAEVGDAIRQSNTYWAMESAAQQE